MYSKVLVPLDGSDVAECVLPHVEALATTNNPVTVTFLYAVQPLEAIMLEVIMAKPAFKDRIESEARAAAKDYLEKLVSKLKYRESAEAKVVMGRAADAIVDYTKKNKLDLIVMATHGRTGLVHAIMGSVAENVVRHSHCCVYVVKEPCWI